MHILITGLTGYIGSHLARRLLAQGEHQVFGLMRNPLHTTYIEDIQNQITFLPCDGEGMNVLAQVERCRPDLVYHLAAYYTGAHDMDNTTQLVASNIAYGAYLLEAMASCECRNLICATSIMEHCQGDAYRPLNLYAATKRAFRDLLAYYTDTGLLRAGTLVLADTYGPGDRRSKVLNLILDAARSHRAIDLSDGQQDYAAVHIDDVTEAFILAGKQLVSGEWENQQFQVLPDAIPSLRKTVETMVKICGLTVQTNWGTRPAPDRDMRHAPRLYPPVPGWSPRISLEQGLAGLWSGSKGALT